MITCYNCKFSNPRALKGNKTELSYLSSSFAWDIHAEKVYFCSFDCYLETCLENEYFPRGKMDEEETRDEAGFELYKESNKDSLASELLANPGVQDFLSRNNMTVAYKAAPKKMVVEEEMKSWADM